MYAGIRLSRLFLALAPLLVVAMATPTLAQQQQQPAQQQQQAVDFHADLLRVDHLIGLKVRNIQGQDLGSIRDIALDPDEDRVLYLVLAYDRGFLRSSSFFAIPWESVRLSGDGDRIIVDANKNVLDRSAGFSRDNWPLEADYQLFGVPGEEGPAVRRPTQMQPGRDRQVERAQPREGQTDLQRREQQLQQRERDLERRERELMQREGRAATERRETQTRTETRTERRTTEHAGSGALDTTPAGRTAERPATHPEGYTGRPAWGYEDRRDSMRIDRMTYEDTSRSASPRRVSEILNTRVRNTWGDDLGRVRDLVIDLREGRLVYAIVGWGGFLGIGRDLAAVPWTAMEYRPRLDVAIVDADIIVLEAVSFDSGSWPDLSDPSYAMMVHEHFDQPMYWEVYGYPQGDQPRRLDFAWQADSEYNRKFNPRTVRTYHGTVESVGTFRPEQGAAGGLRLRAQINGDTVTVHAGPLQFVRQQDIPFLYGDRIIVTGSDVRDGRDRFIMASEIQRGDQTLRLRDENGMPLWDQQAYDRMGFPRDQQRDQQTTTQQQTQQQREQQQREQQQRQQQQREQQQREQQQREQQQRRPADQQPGRTP